MAGRRVVRFAEPARHDLASILDHSEAAFGRAGRDRYEHLVLTALGDLAADPERPGSASRPDLGEGVRAYHIRFSRVRARTADGVVRLPRHFVVYCLPTAEVLLVLRVLHDAMDLARHVSGIGRPTYDDLT